MKPLEARVNFKAAFQKEIDKMLFEFSRSMSIALFSNSPVPPPRTYQRTSGDVEREKGWSVWVPNDKD